MRQDLFLELGVVLLVLGLLSYAASRFAFSAIPFYLGVGFVIGDGGPFSLGIGREFIDLGAELGAILLLFMLGVEYSPEELVDAARRSHVAGAVDLVLNFSPGLVAGLVLGWSLPAAFLLGGVGYISSSGIAAKLLRDLGWTANRETPGVLSVLVIEDLVMAVYLGVAAGLVFEAAPARIAASIAGALLAVAIVLVLALKFGRGVSRALFGLTDEIMLLTMLGAVLLTAGLSEAIGLSGAVAAFLLGLAVSGESARRADEILSPLRDFFGAAFFVFFGLQVDPRTVLPVLMPALILVGLLTATKLVTGLVIARQLGVGRGGRQRAGALLVARGEFSIIIAELGVEAGLEPDLTPVATATVIGLAVLGPLLVRRTARRTEAQAS